MRFFFYRHGQTKGNIEKRYVGITDEDITAEAAERLKNVNAAKAETVYTSPMLRCRHTCELLYTDLKAVIIEDLRETDFGSFEYKNYDELKDNRDYIKWLSSGGNSDFPNGEGSLGFKQRCIFAFENIVFDMARKNIKTAGVVTHGGVIMAVFEKVNGGNFYDYQIKNNEMISAEYDTDKKKFYNTDRKLLWMR